jgi:hypothetical protein
LVGSGRLSPHDAGRERPPRLDRGLLGAPTYFSGFPPEANTRLLDEVGFELVRDELVTIREPEGDATFHWVLARK